jgi:hypothetical protein
MEPTSQMTGPMTGPLASTGDGGPRRAELRLVNARFQLAQPPEPAPEDWRAGLAQLLGWLGIDAEFPAATPTSSRRLPRMADWGIRSASPAPVFAPWLGWAPSAFQHGGLPGLPAAQFVASYLIDHGRGAGVDVVLMSPHPAQCLAEEAGAAPLPRAGVVQAMIRAATAEGREKLAIIVHARQRNAVARQLLTTDRALTRGELALDILTIEDALPPLMAGAALWDAIITLPDLRSTVFTLLAQTSGAACAWPMLWHGQGLLRVTCEVQGEGLSRPALDAPALIHALALALHHAGSARAALRLHEAWSRLRSSGVTTIGRNDDAPYVTTVKDSDFIAMLCAGTAVSKRPVQGWRALNDAKNALPGSQSAPLRVVVSNTPSP